MNKHVRFRLVLWKKVEKWFSRRKAGLSVVRLMMEYGIRIDESGRLYIGDIELSDYAVARAAKVDRRVVKDTAKYLLSNHELKEIFTKLKPAGPSLVDIAPHLGYTVIKVYADPHSPGILASVSSILAAHGLVIRQALADDPDLYPEPALTLVIEGRIPAEGLEKLQNLKNIRSFTILALQEGR